jgi:3-deoxy-D-manno-octulosonate 8-phosphate phosphatase (KDO 8-P phosphatase)
MKTTSAFNDKARAIKLLILDVDGVLTDGRIYLGVSEEIKAYHVHDGLGVTLAQTAGIITAIITGRKSESVSRRAQELHIDHLIQGRPDKLQAATELATSLGLSLQDVCYIGDDLIDLAIMSCCRLACCPADARAEIRTIADLVSGYDGGRGAVREIVEEILKARSVYQKLLNTYMAGEGEAASAVQQ